MSITPDTRKSNAKLARYYYHDVHCDCDAQTLSLDGHAINCQIIPSKHLELYYSEIIGCTALHLAARINNTSNINVLLGCGADPMFRNQNGLTPLHLLFLSNNIESLRGFYHNNIESLHGFYHIKHNCKLLLSAQMRSGNTENPKDKYGFSHFHIACMANHTGAIEFFLKSGASVNETTSADSPNFPGYSPLHLAAMHFAPQATEMLLKYGANTQLKNTKGMTFLCMLPETMRFAIEASNTDDKLKMMSFLLHTDSYPIDSFGLTHFHIACSGAELSIVERLLPNITDINRAVDMDAPSWAGFTALHFAAHYSVEIVKTLVTNGGNLMAKDAKDLTPLDICIDSYGAEDVHAILSLDATCSGILMSDGRTTLTSLILAMKDTEDFDDFLNANAHIANTFVPLDAAVWQGQTPLHMAVRFFENSTRFDEEDENSAYIIERLIEGGADVNAQDIRGRSPIHLAFQREIKVPSYHDNPLSNLLLDFHDQIVDVVDDDNLSHLHIACRMGREDAVTSILQSSVDVNLAFKGQRYECCVTPGSTPLHCAASSSVKSITELLLSRGADAHLKNASGMTAIHDLRIQGPPYHAAEPMSDNALWRLPNLRDDVDDRLGLSHLHVAVLSANVAAVAQLLDNGADVNRAILRHENLRECLYCRAGYTPLDVALDSLREHVHTAEVQMAMLELLLRRGAEVLMNGLVPVDFRQASAKLKRILSLLRLDDELLGRLEKEIGLTMLHVACSRRDYELVETLLSSGADVNAQINEKSRLWPGYTALHVLIDLDDRLRVDELSCVKKILRASKDFTVNPTRLDGLSHFHVACCIGDVDSVEKFLKNGVDVNQPTDFFIKRRPSLSDNHRCFIGCTPLHFAATSSRYGVDAVSQLQLVDLLLNHGADVDAEDVNGDTPLHFMAVLSCEREDVILRMVKSEANVNFKNARNETPLQTLMRINEGISVENVESYLKFERLLNCGIGRIHSIVSKRKKIYQKEPGISVALYIRCIRIFERLGCSVNDRDSLGRTPLHLAVLFQNIEAISALVMTGADVNVADATGKTAFDCLIQLYTINSEERSASILPREILSIFVIYMKKLLLCGLDVVLTNQSLMIEAVEKFHLRDVTVPTLFEDQIREIENVRVGQTMLTLGNFLSETGAVVAYATLPRTDRDAIDTFFKNEIHLHDEYSEVAGILLLQYRKSADRVELNQSALLALNIMSRLPLPHLCSEAILKFLSNSALCNMIDATTYFTEHKHD